MLTWSKKALSLLLITIVLVPAPAAHADWFSNLTDKIQTNSPTSWEGQKRGYFTGGGMSYRLKTSKTPLLSIQAPRIQAGCGGVDAFWGGFGYMSPEYLVQAFQNVMTAAPAYAFKLALQNLCDPCDDAMTSIQQMAQAINNIAMDECSASQALVNFGGDAIASLSGMDAQSGESEFGNWIKEKTNYLTKAASTFNQKVRDLQNWQYCGGFANHDGWTKCAQFVDITGSIWEKAKSIDRVEDNSPDDLFIQMSRAFFGDLIITEASSSGTESTDGPTMYNVKYEEPCSEMTARELLKSMLGNIIASTAQKNAENITGETSLPQSNGTAPSSNATMVPTGEMDVATAREQIKLRGVIKSGDTVTGVAGCVVQSMPESLRVYERALAAITDVSNKMTTAPRSQLDANTLEIIKQSSIPIYQIINMLAYRAQNGSVITAEETNALVKLASLGYAQFLLENYVNRAESVLDQTYIQMQRGKNGTPTPPEDMKRGYEAIKSKIGTFRGTLLTAFSDIHQTYMAAMKDHFEFMRMKDYYTGLLKTKGLTNAYRGF